MAIIIPKERITASQAKSRAIGCYSEVISSCLAEIYKQIQEFATNGRTRTATVHGVNELVMEELKRLLTADGYEVTISTHGKGYMFEMVWG